MKRRQKIAWLNINIELAKQSYEKIIAIIPRQKLGSRIDFSEDEKTVLVDLLSSYIWHMEQIEQITQDTLLEQDVPIQEASTNLSEFYNKELLPAYFDLRVLYSAVDPREFTLDFGAGPKTYCMNIPPNTESELKPEEILIAEEVAGLLSAALDFFDNAVIQCPLEDEELKFDENDVALARKLVASPLFRPNHWLSNAKLLQPVRLENPGIIPLHVKLRLKEVYRSFVFGNWMAVFALSRSVLEYSIINRASKLGIDVYKEEGGDAFGIRELVRLASNRIENPDVSNAMYFLVEKGNWVMHPKKKDNLIQAPLILRHHALDCVRNLWVVVNELYVHR